MREACAAALDLEDFDEDIFLERVDTIQVLDGQILEFHFCDGTVSQIEWVSTAKKDCWTEEHKDRQREWMKNYMANCTDGRFNEFTTRIRCEPLRQHLPQEYAAQQVSQRRQDALLALPDFRRLRYHRHS